MNPPWSAPLLMALAAVVLIVAALGSWRASAGLGRGRRSLLLGLRLLAIAGALVILFNPGKWTLPDDERERPWVILTDVSASMAQPAAGERTRAETSGDLLDQAARHAKRAGVPVRIHPFASSLQAAAAPGSLPASTGDGSRLLPALSEVLQSAAASGESMAGIVVLSDGRQTLDSSQAELDALALRARSRNISIHTVAIGADSPSPDLILLQPRASLTAFAGQSLRIPFALSSTGLGPLRPAVRLLDETGAEIATLSPDLPPGETVTAAFEITAPEASARWTLETDPVQGEVRSGNNSTSLQIRVITSKTRVFLAEGAPYWDSKFLAQLLRQQPHMDLHSVHRLSDKRYFRIDSGTDDTAETDTAVFPATLDELSRYDLIIFGKHVDPFLTGDRAEALRQYVRDRGGAVLFSRGKPTSSDLPALEPLEPVTWAAAMASDFRFAPTQDGAAAGLFGQALPAPESSLWTSLPNLKDGRQIDSVKPFTRVLAEGVPPSAAGHSGRFPSLLVRRYGQGVTGLVNGDGLWKWDFYPEARELGNRYEDFWTQLIQWMAAYSEFLPGQDFSLRLPATRGEAGQPRSLVLSYRGPEPAPQPRLRITGPSAGANETTPAPVTDPSGRPGWRASFTPDQPGDWLIEVVDPRPSAPSTPLAVFTVPHPPAESDDLSPDPEFLRTLATITGGESVAPDDFEKLLDHHLAAPVPQQIHAAAVWRPSWNHAVIALIIAALLAGEWFFRRRLGLA